MGMGAPTPARLPQQKLPGKPSIMVDGMMPTTAKAGFVSAVLEAGYHVELAGVGHYPLAALRAKVAEIQYLKVLH
jgi:fatty acid synthase subunit beta